MSEKRYGLRVAKSGSVTNQNNSQIAYDSEFESPKVTKPVVGKFTTDGSGNWTVPVPHNLTYAPAIFVFIKYPDGKWYQAGSGNIRAYTDRLNVYIQSYQGTASTTYTYKFWILTDPAQDIT